MRVRKVAEVEQERSMQGGHHHAARDEIEQRIATVQRVLVTRERLEAYVELKTRKVLPALRRALAKIGEGSYGYCDDCADVIEQKRLSAVPGATRCHRCQEEFEHNFQRAAI